MTLDRYAEAVDTLDPEDDEVETAELVVTDDVLVKAFVLGPGGEIDAHEHGDATNVFHVLEGEPTAFATARPSGSPRPPSSSTSAATSTEPATTPTNAPCSRRVSVRSPDGRRDRPGRAGDPA